ncbi:cobalt-zinc-cadmium resistance protein CzcD [bacterium BMS3Abin02]|nr:cobalt-zinc-cadmium resistance protein CzcD [bacterium BMS3Abin02]GBE22131.1 cobalt-zinc-cadmium resistance protein CzcD [bacterium BMS3Bbin01]HDH25721.1 cation transporter [Actinomycetota bacterium]HDL48686.1 cation transporter [Actinomycetota bacterium]
MSTGHTHASVTAGRKYIGRLWVTFGLVVVFMIVEAITAVVSGSLALLSDAGHMATDAVGLGMSLAAIIAATRVESSGNLTYGVYRLEILAALANSVLLLGVGAYVLVEAAKRLEDPTKVMSGPMLIVAILGLIVNIVSWLLLRKGAKESLNLEGAFLEVMADAIGSVGVIAAALILRYTGWLYADPLFGAAIGLFIIPRAWRLGRKAIRVLIEAAPTEISVNEMRERLRILPGVIDVHDLHVWTLTSDMNVASAHLMIDQKLDSHPVLDQARDLLKEEYGITHATLQVEPDTHEGCEDAPC